MVLYVFSWENSSRTGTGHDTIIGKKLKTTQENRSVGVKCS